MAKLSKQLYESFDLFFFYLHPEVRSIAAWKGEMQEHRLQIVWSFFRRKLRQAGRHLFYQPGEFLYIFWMEEFFFFGSDTFNRFGFFFMDDRRFTAPGERAE